jgi:hypothetical protein
MQGFSVCFFWNSLTFLECRKPWEGRDTGFWGEKEKKIFYCFFGTLLIAELPIPEDGKGEGEALIYAFLCFLRDFGWLAREESHTYAIFWLSLRRYVTMPACIFGA